jgi:NadR type nicotinamide-nucleotide adenylyltransferase
MTRIGLTLGKYAPLHKGHQYVIETMLKEMDEVIVVVYNSDVTNIPLPTRSAWIRALYPQVKVIEAWDGPVGADHDPEYEKAEEEHIKGLLGDTQLDAFYCSEYYGEHMAHALNCQNRIIDVERSAVPISSTLIRGDAYRYRSYVDPLVYKDLIVKAVFLGAMSTGKSTLTEALAKRYHTTFASEYGREYWAEHEVDRRFDLAGFDELADEHIRREDLAIRDANKFFFVDTNAITTYVYALDYHGRAPEHLTHLADANSRRYDLFFLCDDDIPYDDTWDRSGDQKRHVFQRQIIADLEKRKLPFIPLSGTLEERMAQVDRSLFTPSCHCPA